ncbi:probable phosphorylase b kinase regulatory subunit beta [Biomphalaria glabrata]|nr:probable phosphorylase b kinase regulatory subunit beta [Biomphalaria glabrata]XP_055866091.1 probable phosphorylase b kinase regulatory subunit beta [Biomphalaria glabrata]XP_055871632.1 probable phosphorylase b kinase regulatory subunit beta [Biomphalaria glabrata]XP_055873936.1 probable phosphorylase b kinase regulatory subunit beta [Biomphalaria glabrata]XP_055888599.1 probable phosphorylase b kinase regulatory subunit beta [Biomphalaria glabrata]XP_055895455.1 probable phosphorylase b 
MLNIKLNGFYMLSKHQILRNQSPINGLFPSIGSDKNTNRIAHVQDSIYCAVAVWSLAQVYNQIFIRIDSNPLLVNVSLKIDDDQGSIISWAKLMIGMLQCWIFKLASFSLRATMVHLKHFSMCNVGYDRQIK